AALAGCSAGAMALTAGAPPGLGPGGRPRRAEADDEGDGLGLVGALAVIPHFDRLEGQRADVVEWFAGWQPPGTTLVGVEEETALVTAGDRWQVRGRGAVWVLAGGGPGKRGRERFGAGDEVDLPRP
ncbi:MAG: hypothetical protein ACRDY1_15670, partial [Acidimicrobiales bacterium]